jgi:hypothetical protein
MAPNFVLQKRCSPNAIFVQSWTFRCVYNRQHSAITGHYAVALDIRLEGFLMATMLFLVGFLGLMIFPSKYISVVGTPFCFPH